MMLAHQNETRNPSDQKTPGDIVAFASVQRSVLGTYRLHRHRVAALQRQLVAERTLLLVVLAPGPDTYLALKFTTSSADARFKVSQQRATDPIFHWFRHNVGVVDETVETGPGHMSKYHSEGLKQLTVPCPIWGLEAKGGEERTTRRPLRFWVNLRGRAKRGAQSTTTPQPTKCNDHDFFLPGLGPSERRFYLECIGAYVPPWLEFLCTQPSQYTLRGIDCCRSGAKWKRSGLRKTGPPRNTLMSVRVAIHVLLPSITINILRNAGAHRNPLHPLFLILPSAQQTRLELLQTVQRQMEILDIRLVLPLARLQLRLKDGDLRFEESVEQTNKKQNNTQTRSAHANPKVSTVYRGSLLNTYLIKPSELMFFFSSTFGTTSAMFLLRFRAVAADVTDLAPIIIPAGAPPPAPAARCPLLTFRSTETVVTFTIASCWLEEATLFERLCSSLIASHRISVRVVVVAGDSRRPPPPPTSIAKITEDERPPASLSGSSSSEPVPAPCNCRSFSLSVVSIEPPKSDVQDSSPVGGGSSTVPTTPTPALFSFFSPCRMRRFVVIQLTFSFSSNRPRDLALISSFIRNRTRSRSSSTGSIAVPASGKPNAPEGTYNKLATLSPRSLRIDRIGEKQITSFTPPSSAPSPAETNLPTRSGVKFVLESFPTVGLVCCVTLATTDGDGYHGESLFAYRDGYRFATGTKVLFMPPNNAGATC
uniref:Uncharacterized protein n=1 Tax=Anopheles atroparvus TaxID=41427 RepID=A0A182JDA2_ANOAO